MRIETARLILSSGAVVDAPHVLRVFNSNPDFIEACEGPGQRSLELIQVEKYISVRIARVDSHCLMIRMRENGRIIGLTCLSVPHPRKLYPWLEMLVLVDSYQRCGFGSEAMAAIEQKLSLEGWRTIGLSVLETNARALRFWEGLGYMSCKEHPEGLPAAWLLQKPLR
jgi:GNAT superfamily N-acetyltransferase